MGKRPKKKQDRVLTKSGVVGVENKADPVDGAALARALAGGKATVESPLLWGQSPQAWLPPQSAEDQWRVLDLDADALRKLPPQKVLDLLVDLSPDVSRALFDYLRLSNPDWTLTAYVPATLDISQPAVTALAVFVDRLITLYGSADVVFNRLFLNTWMRGGIFMELVLDSDRRTPIDLATPDPGTVRFKKKTVPKLGERWCLGQMQQMGYVELDQRPTVRYIPFDPLPGNPYGRALASPALFSALFFLGILHDIRRVVAQQGYPRIDISIDFEAMRASMPLDAQDDPAKLKAWVNEAVTEVKRFYANLQPDDAYIHSSSITVNPGGKAVGAVGADNLAGINGLIGALERLLVKALKTMPLTMGMADGVSEANANRQLEIHLLGIQAVQRLIEQALEWCLGLALRAQGIQADVEFRFSQNRAAEQLRDEQVFQLRLTNASAAREEGFWSQDEASQHAVGHNAVEQEPVKFQRQKAREDAANEATAKGVGLVSGSSTDDNNTKPKDGKDSKKKMRVLAGLGPQGRIYHLIDELEAAGD